MYVQLQNRTVTNETILRCITEQCKSQLSSGPTVSNKIKETTWVRAIHRVTDGTLSHQNQSFSTTHVHTRLPMRIQHNTTITILQGASIPLYVP